MAATDFSDGSLVDVRETSGLSIMNGTTTPTGRDAAPLPPAIEINDYDVLIIGAGISGINMAYRTQTMLKGKSYVVLERRADMGGTWDIMRYPGIRSDSDLHTFGFPWRVWTQESPIAEGP